MSFISDKMEKAIIARLSAKDCSQSFHSLIKGFWPQTYKKYEDTISKGDN